MKAIVVRQFGGPEVLELSDAPDPHPGPGQVLVRVHAAGVNPVETYVRSGKYPNLPTLPYTPGADAGGTLEAVGEGVTGWKSGDRVWTHGTLTGAYAELALCNVATVSALPDGVTYAQGAAVGIPAGAAWRALFVRGQASAAETVVIHGATGGVGISAVQLARAAGLTVIATGGSDRGKQLAALEGAHHVLPHSGPEFVEGVRRITDGRGAELVIEMLANVNLPVDFEVLAKGGRVVVVGSRGAVEIDPRETMGRELSVLGMTNAAATPEQRKSTYAALGAALESRTLRPVIGEEIPLAEASLAHERVMAGDSYGKIVLVP